MLRPVLRVMNSLSTFRLGLMNLRITRIFITHQTRKWYAYWSQLVSNSLGTKVCQNRRFPLYVRKQLQKKWNLINACCCCYNFFPSSVTKKAGASVTLTLLLYRAKNGEPFWKTSHIQGSNKASVPRLIWRLIFTWQEKKTEESVDMNFLNFIFFLIEIFLFCLPCHIRLIFIVCLAGSLGNACASSRVLMRPYIAEEIKCL